MQHRSNSKYGENIYMMGAARPPVKVTGKMPVDEWYKEIKYFAFGSGGLSSQTVHFTQVVWKSSKRIGVGRATNRYRSFKKRLRQKKNDLFIIYCRLGCTYIVTNYDPPGNLAGKFNSNVPKIC
jgi:glioma pathogenesis-related protein 2